MTSEKQRSARLRTFAEMERANGLFEYRFDGWSAWRVMRNPLHARACGLPFSAPVRPTFVRVWEATSATLGWLGFLAFGRRRDLFIQTCCSALRMREGDKFLDVNFDGLLKRHYSHLKLMEINSPNFERQIQNALFPSKLDPVMFTFWGRVLGYLFPVKALDFCTRVSELLKRELDMTVDPRWLLTRISTVHWQAKLYGMLLARLKPKAVLVADTGAYALRLAAFRKQIPFLELQHGIFNNEHPDAIPLWAGGSRSELLLPDILAVRGEYWLDQLDQTLQGRDCAVAVGNEQIDAARLSRLRREDDTVFRMVLTSQGCDTARLAAWVGRMIAAAPSSENWELVIKLHPFYDNDPGEFGNLAYDKRVKLIGGAEEPNVFDILADADVHLSISSACHFDAMAIGVPTIVIPLAGYESMLSQVDETLMFLARQPADVWRVLHVPAANSDQVRLFSAPGFTDNLDKLICEASADRIENAMLATAVCNRD